MHGVVCEAKARMETLGIKRGQQSGLSAEKVPGYGESQDKIESTWTATKKAKGIGLLKPFGEHIRMAFCPICYTWC